MTEGILPEVPVLYLGMCQLPIPILCGLINQYEVKKREKCSEVVVVVVYLKLAHDLFGGPQNNFTLARLPLEMSVRNSGTQPTASVGERPKSHIPEI